MRSLVICTALLGSMFAQDALALRVMALDSCSDALVLRYHRPGDILSLTAWSSEAPGSPIAKRARRFHKNHATIEEVFFFQPDLVVKGMHGNPALLKLSRSRFRTIALPVAKTVPEALEHHRIVAAQFGREEQAERYKVRILKRLRDLRKKTNFISEKKVLTLMQGRLSAGRGTLLHDLYHRIGLTNTASGAEGWTILNREEIIRLRPDRLVTAHGHSKPGHDLRFAGFDRRVDRVSESYLLCTGSWLEEMIEALAREQKAK